MRTSLESPLQGILEIGHGGGITSLSANNAVQILLTGACAFIGTMRFYGTARVTVLNSASALT